MTDGRDQVDSRYWRRVERARRMTPQERVAESVKLSESVVRIMCDAVRREKPLADEVEVMEVVRQRVNQLRALARRT